MAAPQYRVDPGLYEYATERQRQMLEAINEHGSMRAASKSLGVHNTVAMQTLRAVERKAAIHGYSPQHDLSRKVAPGFVAKGHSTLYRRGEAEPVLQWVKTREDAEAREQVIREAVAALIEDAPKLVALTPPLDWQADVIPWIQIGDAHLGMLAHAAEVGENFDLKIAESEMCAAICTLIDELPNCERIVVNDLGDFTHYENFGALTEASGHQLDFDSRFPKMIRVYVRVMRFIVDRALSKAKFVDVIVNQGNHSRTNDIWMAELLRACYGHTQRVNVLNNDSIFIGYRMGNTFVMTCHSDKCKPAQLADVMTTDFRKDYGETEFHYVDIGHIHHSMVLKEHPSIFVESFNHLATLDKWAHDKGYRNRRSLSVVLRSREFGEVGRRVLPIQEIRKRLDKAAGARSTTEREVFSV